MGSLPRTRLPDSESRMPAATADRNLLFGIVAVQMDFVGRDDLLAAMNAWVLDKGKSLGEILVAMGKLPPDELALLDTRRSAARRCRCGRGTATRPRGHWPTTWTGGWRTSRSRRTA